MNLCQCGKRVAGAGFECSQCRDKRRLTMSDEELIRFSSNGDEDFKRRWNFFQAKRREIELMEGGRDRDIRGFKLKNRKGA